MITIVLCSSSRLHATDLTKVDRHIAKQPACASKSPHYALLVFGSEAKDRAWMVKDGAGAVHLFDMRPRAK
jgi:hypothetical protein